MHKNTTHGMKGTRPYRIWTGMKTRCYNKNHLWFKHYGGKGVKVCDKWLKFQGFWDDMRGGYSEDLTLDRIDGSSDYSLENCRWATKKEQSNNARNNINVTAEGKTQSLAMWAQEKNMPYYMLYTRLFVYKWDIKDLFLPKGETLRRPRKKRIE